MAVFSSLRNKLAHPTSAPTEGDAISGDTTPAHQDYGTGHEDSKTPGETEVTEGSTSSDQLPSEDVQDGVRQVEALTLVWTKTSLGAAYIL